jgi:hypothetical protein
MLCVFERDFADKRRPVLLETVTPGCEWVLEGCGLASVKHDGTACAVIGGVLHARYDAKRGKPVPVNGVPCDPEPDPIALRMRMVGVDEDDVFRVLSRSGGSWDAWGAAGEAAASGGAW